MTAAMLLMAWIALGVAVARTIPWTEKDMDLMLIGLQKPHSRSAVSRVIQMDGSLPTRDELSKTVPAEKHREIATRRAQVLEYVRTEGIVATQELADHFKVSRDTSWHDLTYLESIGAVAVREKQRMKLYYVPAMDKGSS